MPLLPRLPYGEKYLKMMYGGGIQTVLGRMGGTLGKVSANVMPAGAPESFTKAMTPWDAPTSPYAAGFNSKYSLDIHQWTVSRDSTLQQLLRKTTYQAEGDSMKYIPTDVNGLQGIWTSSTPFTSGSVESAPTVVNLENMYPAFMADPWEESWVSSVIASYKDEPKQDPVKNMAYHVDNFPFQIEKYMLRTVDSVNNDGSSNLFVESLDRIISSSDEAHTDYVNSAADPDLHYGNSSALVDRSTDTSDSFGAGAGDGNSLATAARIVDLGYIDDVMKAIKKYSKNKNYVLFMGDSTLDEIQYIYGNKERFIDGPMNISYGINGVNTRAGRDVGLQVASFRSRNVKMPIFTSEYIAGEVSTNISATVTDQNIGNIYFLDLDALEQRYALPTSLLQSNDADMLQPDNLYQRSLLVTAFQLISTNPRALGAIKYLKAM